MARGTHSATVRDGVRDLLADPRYEVMPFDSFDEQVTHLPDGATITITASPTLDLPATIEKSELAAERGFEVVPHIAARYVRDAEHLTEIVERLTEAGITDVFVPGGDREEPIGEFDSAYSLLSTMDELGIEFEDVGITGYPEGHPFLSEETLAAEMDKKRPHATYLATQLCYDPGAILAWIESVRERGVDLPVQVGIPGVMKYQRLLGISQKVGVGDSVRFLRKTSGILGFVRQLVGSRGKYTPDELVDGLAPYAADPEYGIRGLHIYTFNQVADTEAWRLGRLDG
jgi:methylenetetrahydrofolate reductase (NADPH)